MYLQIKIDAVKKNITGLPNMGGKLIKLNWVSANGPVSGLRTFAI